MEDFSGFLKDGMPFLFQSFFLRFSSRNVLHVALCLLLEFLNMAFEPEIVAWLKGKRL
jgi:hypothetical protein